VTDPKPDDDVLEQAEREGESLLIGELLLYIERYDDAERPGVSDDQLQAYVEALVEKNVFPRSADVVREQIDQRTEDSEAWVEEDAFYRVGTHRVSNFPKRWHEQLGPDDDLRAIVRVMAEELAASPQGTDRGGQGRGVPEQLLLDAATVLADYDRGDAKTELEELRDRDELVMDADMNREGRVQLPDRN